MKCPKCGYIGFEDVDRCRNCGYEFSLAAPVSTPELPIRAAAADDLNPLDDLSLVDGASADVPAPRRADRSRDLDNGLHEFPQESARTRPSSTELPLFRADDVEMPLITSPSPPRAPLAVRRATPEVPRLRSEQPRPQALDLSLDLDDGPSSVSTEALFTPADRATIARWPTARPERPESAAIILRLVAVIIDVIILAAIDAIVVYFTMQICGLTLGDAGLLPKGPLLAFFLVQNGGYLVAFTAGGQTLGKMATGIKVIATESSAGSLDLGRATTRTLVWLMLAVPAGLGFLTVFSRDHRGLHDRFAGTRVVRATLS